MRIEFNRIITLSEYLEMTKFSSHWRQRVIAYVALLLIASVSWWLYWYFVAMVMFASFIASVLLLDVIARFWAFPLLHRKAYDPNDGGIVIITDDSVTVEGIGTESKMSWSLFSAYEITENLILLRTHNGKYAAVPKRLINEAEFCELTDFLRDRFGKPTK
jgi:hypothetical protein